ncbi:MAG: SRPBCC domain-containing protein, partial [Thermoplasmata archaeon]
MCEPVHQEVEFTVGPEKIFDMDMDSAERSRFTKVPATISREVGGAFSCHRGQIVGRNVELIPGRRIVQAWRVSDWPSGVYSLVRFELSPHGSGTRLVLDHTGIPE